MARKRLWDFAKDATEASDPRETEGILYGLLFEAIADAALLAETEGTTEPIEIAYSYLLLTTVDTTPCYDMTLEDFRPEDDFVQHLELRRQNLPVVLQIFGSIVDRAKARN